MTHQQCTYPFYSYIFFIAKTKTLVFDLAFLIKCKNTIIIDLKYFFENKTSFVFKSWYLFRYLLAQKYQYFHYSCWWSIYIVNSFKDKLLKKKKIMLIVNIDINRLPECFENRPFTKCAYFCINIHVLTCTKDQWLNLFNYVFF